MKVTSFFTLGMLIMSLAFEPIFTAYPMYAATTWVVDTLGVGPNPGPCSPGQCSIDRAIAAASSGDTITFSVTGMIYLNFIGLTIDKNLTISGPGADKLAITGTGRYQVFHITAGKSVTISGLTITYGKSTNGGGIFNEGVLTLNQSTVSDHHVTNEGGGLYNTGTAYVNRSTFFDNHATNYGGAIKNFGGVLTITNSTFTANGANSRGGAIDSGPGTLMVKNSTFQGNGAFSAGAIGNLGSASTAINVLMVGNGGGDCLYLFTNDSTNNLSTDTTCSPGFTKVLPEQLLLGSLRGNPAYFPLVPGNAAIDTGTNVGCPALDEPGMPRPQDGDHDGTAVCDVGAFELMPHALYLPAIIVN